MDHIVNNSASKEELASIDPDLLASLQQLNTLVLTNKNTIALLEETNKTLEPTYNQYGLTNFNDDSSLIDYFKTIGLMII